MHKKCLLITALLITAFILLPGCDERGELSDRETQKLYDEIREVVLSDEFWEYESEPWLKDPWTSEAEKESSIEFIKAVTFEAFGKDAQYAKHGMWFSSKRYCKICEIDCGFSVPFDGENCTAVSFSVSRYSNGSYVLGVDYMRETNESSIEYIDIRFSPVAS